MASVRSAVGKLVSDKGPEVRWESVWKVRSVADGPVFCSRCVLVGCFSTFLVMGVAVKACCGVFQVSLEVTWVLGLEETNRYHHPVTLASGGKELKSWALAASGG